MDVIYALAAVQGIILAVVILSGKAQSKANLLIGGYLICIAFTLGMNYLIVVGAIDRFHPLLAINEGITFLCGPFIWLYARLLLGKQGGFSIREFYHFLPFLAMVALAFFMVYNLPALEKQQLIQQGADSIRIKILMWSVGVKIVHSMVYYYLTYKLIRENEVTVVDEASHSGVIEIKWLRWLLFLITAISLVLCAWFMAYMVFGISFVNRLLGPVVTVFLFLLVYGVAVFAIKYPRLFNKPDRARADKPKYHSSSLTHKGKQEVWGKLQSHIRTAKPYLNPELTVDDLSIALNVNRKVLSQVINECSGSNFFSFINTCRVVEFKQQVVLPENRHLTLLAIALNCGFSSKSSFYSIFKKQEGVTPRQFLLSKKMSLAN